MINSFDYLMNQPKDILKVNIVIDFIFTANYSKQSYELVPIFLVLL